MDCAECTENTGIWRRYIGSTRKTRRTTRKTGESPMQGGLSPDFLGEPYKNMVIKSRITWIILILVEEE